MPLRAHDMSTGVVGPESKGHDRRSVVQSVERATKVLFILRDSPEPLSAMEVAEQAGFERTVAHRLLRTLVLSGLVSEPRSGRYGIGAAAALLGNRYVDGLAVRRAALPLMVDMQARLMGDQPWTLTLAIAVGDTATIIERMWSASTPLELVFDTGGAFPIDTSSAGRCILAYLPEEEVVALIGEARSAALSVTLEEIRQANGVGLSRGEASKYLQSVAAVIRSRSGAPMGALGVGGADLGAELDYDSPLASQLRRSASVIGNQLP
ncbi:IclR family transcriptional regulator [Streptomyces sp. NPDC001393]